MRLKRVFTCIVLTIVRGSGGAQVRDLDKEAGIVEYVHLITRNGETNVAKILQLDPYQYEQFWPEGMGKLNTLGVLNQHQLGDWLGERYAILLNNRTYTRSTYEAYADTKEETRLSGSAMSQGMFKSSQNDALTAIKWIPIPVMDEKNFEFTNQPCKKYDDSKLAFLASKEFATIQNRYSVLLKDAADYIGINNQKIEFTDVIEVFNTLVIEASRNMNLSEWGQSVYNSTLPEAVSLAYTLRTFTPDMKKTVGGRFVRSLLNAMTDKINSTKKRPNMTSSTLGEEDFASVMDILGIFNRVPVPFNAVMMIELRKHENNYTVTILFSNDTTATSDGKDRVVHFLKLPNCTEICPFGKFKEIMSLYVVDDWGKHCAEELSAGYQQPNATKPECVYRFNWIQMTISAIIGGVVIMFTIVTACRKMAKRNTITLNNQNKNNNEDDSASETAAGFIISLGDVTSTVIFDRVDAFVTPFDLFTLPPPFITPPDAGMF